MFYYLRREAGFYRRLVRLALPLVLQNLITTSLGFVDTFMVGLLGQDELSAVTAANTPVFLVQIIILGLISGLTVLVSQYWGKGDVEAINRCMGTALYAGLSISGIVALALLLFPGGVMALVTDNARLVELGAPYLRIVGVSYVFNAASSVYVGMQRSTEKPVMGMTIFAVSMLLNTLLNYILIFGKFGAPALGVTGAAVATLTSRVVEFLITLVCALCSRHVPLLPAAILRPGGAIWRDFARYSAPVLVNETLWGLGVSVMTAIMGHMAISTEMLAAYAVMGVVLICMMPTKAMDITNITGLLRAGGDARTASLIDLSCQWIIAVPLSFVTALVLHAPAAVVCFAIQSENFCKAPWCVLRLRSRKWIHDVTRGSI